MRASTRPASMRSATRTGPARLSPRFSVFRDLSITYEGNDKALSIHPMDLSPHGMFINTAEHFPEGAVLKVDFHLTHSNYRVSARAEVRYCLEGVGIGVEFIGIGAEDQRAIRGEIKTHRRIRAVSKTRS